MLITTTAKAMVVDAPVTPDSNDERFPGRGAMLDDIGLAHMKLMTRGGCLVGILLVLAACTPKPPAYEPRQISLPSSTSESNKPADAAPVCALPKPPSSMNLIGPIQQADSAMVGSYAGSQKAIRLCRPQPMDLLRADTSPMPATAM